MKARLFARTGPMKGAEFPFENGVTLGRDPDNAIVLPSESVSKHHARIFWDDRRGRYILEDLDSLNGTELDGVKVAGQEPLRHLHVISLAGVLDLLFQDLEACRRRHGSPRRPAPELKTTPLPPSPLPPPQTLAAGAAPEGTQLDLQGIELPSFLATPPAVEGTQLDFEAPELPSFLSQTPVRYGLEVPVLKSRIPLAQGENVVGRARGVAVRIDTLDVSRRHAVLRVQGERVTVRDEGSSNHTFVDEEKVTEEVVVRPENQLCFGSVEARLVRIKEED